jgi:potassium-dependent mechanosensitive channel
VNLARAPRALFVSLSLLGLVGLAAAQEPAARPESEEPPAPIPVAEIPRQSEEVAARLRAIEPSLRPDPSIQTIEESLPSWIEAVREAKALRPENPTLRELEGVRNQWLSRQTQLNEWLSLLEARTSAIAQRVEELRKLRDVWAATRTTSPGDMPAAIRSRVDEVRVQIDRVARDAQNRLGTLLTIQNQLSEQASTVEDELQTLNEALTKARDSLFVSNAPALWTALIGSEDRPRLLEEARQSWRQAVTSVRGFLLASPERLLAQTFLFLGLLWLFRELRKRAARFAEQDGLEASTKALSHPFANALLITLLATRLFHPHAPTAVYELNRLILLLPLLRILPGLVYSSMRGPLYGLAALYVGDLFAGLVPSEALLSRMLQLGVSSVLFGGLVYLTRPRGPATRLDLGPWWRAAIAVARVGAVGAAVAFGATVLGRVRLSEFLTDSTLSCAYAAVVLYAGTLVLQSLLTLLLETRASRSFRAVHAKREYLRTIGTKLIRLAAFVAFLSIALGSLQFFDSVVDAARVGLAAGLSIGEIEITVGDLLALVVTLWLTVQVSRLTRVVLAEDVLPRFDLPRGVPSTISVLTHYAILFIGFAIALAAAGIELGRFAILAGAFGVGIGFGLQNVVNNFVSGLILLFERPIQVGDTVELGTLLGNVQRIGMRSSTVRTFEGADVIVPNAHLIDSQVVNWTLSDRLRRAEVVVGVAYGTRPRQVLDILLEVAKAHPDVLESPEPYALFNGFGESSLDFALRAWTANFDDFLRVRSELRLGVHDALEKAGITIPFPQRDLHVKSMPSDSEEHPVPTEATAMPDHG